MRLPLFPTALLSVSLAAWMVATAPATRAEGPATVIGALLFDPDTTTLTLTYSGANPHYRLHHLSNGRFYLDFTGAQLARPGVVSKAVGAPLVRYTLAPRPGSAAVRLAFTLSRPGGPAVAVDELSHTVVVYPLGHLEPSTPEPTPSPTPVPVMIGVATPALPAVPVGFATVVGRPVIDAGLGAVVIPYNGALPAVRYSVLASDRRWFIVDFPRTFPATGRQPAGRFADPLFLRWGMARREAGVTRLALRAASERPFSLEVHPERNQVWIFGAERPAAAPGHPSVLTYVPTPSLAAPFALPAGVATAAPIAVELAPPSPAIAAFEPTERTLRQPLPVIMPAATPVPVAFTEPSPTPRPRPPAKTHLTGATFEAATQTLLVPYEGAVPDYTVEHLSPTALVVDFPATDITANRTLVQAFSDNPLLQRWVGKGDEDGVARFTFNTVSSADVLVGVDRARKQLLLIPENPEVVPLPPNLPTQPSTLFGQAHIDEAIGALVLPYTGASPAFAAASRAPGTLDVEFIGAALQRPALQVESLPGSPDLTYWRLSGRPGRQARVHLALTLPSANQVRMLDDRPNHRLLVVPSAGN